MKKMKKLKAILLAILLLFQFEPIEFKATSAAAFYVQTAAVLEDNTIEVCVYLDEADNIGGIDLELVYDTEKVSFVSSSLGPSLQSSLSDIYHEEEKGEIHYVILYSESKSAHGILLRATFQLKEGESYQPQLIVNELLDSTIEIKDIPYTITYQQADGTWSDIQDMSGEVADETVINEALEQYGAPEDFDDISDQETVSIDSENNISGTAADTEDIVEMENTDEIRETGNEEGKHSYIEYLVLGVVVLSVMGIGVALLIMKQRKNKMNM